MNASVVGLLFPTISDVVSMASTTMLHFEARTYSSLINSQTTCFILLDARNGCYDGHMLICVPAAVDCLSLYGLNTSDRLHGPPLKC